MDYVRSMILFLIAIGASLQAIIHWIIRRLYCKLHLQRTELNAKRRSLRSFRHQSDRFKRRISEIWDNPEVSARPSWEVDKCQTAISNLSEYQAEVKVEMGHHDGEIQRVIKKIRRLQKIQIRYQRDRRKK